MIGKIMMGKSFRGCINYCLHDKLKKDAEELVMKNRAEVILCNKCFGNAGELIKQFNELRLHSQKLSKPVMHITLSLVAGEIKSGNTLSAIAQDCAMNLGLKITCLLQYCTKTQKVINTCILLSTGLDLMVKL